jgi:UDP-GlcNAc:undecaprenyl-phosphate GlcNAc-1-phosphate transferase
MYENIFYDFLGAFALIFFCAKLSYKFNLIDQPNERKIHKTPVAFTGGIAISLCLIFYLQKIEVFDESLAHILSFSFLISCIGAIDDKLNLNVGGKLSLQIIPIIYLILFKNLALTSVGNYNYFELELGSFVFPFTLLCVLFLINSFNYFDGLDGTLVFTTISVLLILYFLVSDKVIHIFLIIIFIPLIAFLFFNFSLFKLPKLFLGDSGSLMLGFVISFLLIYLANEKYVHPILLAWSVVIYVYEFLSINLMRIKKKNSLFKAGKDHIHHLLFYKSKSLLFTNLFLTFVNIIMFSIGYLSFIFLNEFTSLILFIILFIIYLSLRSFFFKN